MRIELTLRVVKRIATSAARAWICWYDARSLRMVNGRWSAANAGTYQWWPVVSQMAMAQIHITGMAASGRTCIRILDDVDNAQW